MALIEVVGLTKQYPGGVRAVDDITFQVDEGEIFGFLGPNGAGKTTTIRVIVTLLAPTAGRVTVDGVDVVEQPEAVRHRIGYAAQFIGVDDDLTARENLVLQGRLHGLGRSTARRRSDELLEVFQLTDAADRRAGTFSGGMRRRLDLGQALVHEPRVVFLDEPTTGLDPQNRRALWDYLRRLHERGVTIFLTTQYLEEADALASRLAIIDEGVLVVEGTPEGLKDEVGGESIRIELADPEQRPSARRALAERFGADPVDDGDAGVRLFTPAAGERLADVVRSLDAAGVTPASLQLAEPSLDDVFLRHTGGRMRTEEVRQQRKVGFTRRSRGRRG